MTPYQEAVALSRQAMGRLTVQQLRNIKLHLEDFVDRILVQIGHTREDLGAQGLEQLRIIVQQEYERLWKVLSDSIREGRDSTFQEIQGIWRAAGTEYSRARGVPLAKLMSVRTPPITLMGSWESLSTAGTWRTLIRNSAADAATEANTIVRGAIAEGANPDELARRLRKYVTGAETFQEAFSEVPTKSGNVFKLDLRTIPAAQRGAAQQMVYNAERIAFTELHTARAEAEVQHMYNDPFVEAVQWTLAPDRGTLKRPDECDLLAEADFYGMGPGVYPVSKVPPPPHPWDRCERVPIARSTREIADPKPSPTIQTDPRSSDTKFPREEMLTKGQLERARASAWNAVKNVPEPTSVHPVPEMWVQRTPKEIEEDFFDMLRGDPVGSRLRYNALEEAKGGKVLDADILRELSPDYQMDRTLNAAPVHEPASELIKQMYAEKLKEPPSPGEVPAVMFTAGPAGAGKTSAMANIPEVQEVLKEAQIVYQTAMEGYDSALGKVRAAVENGKVVDITYVQREPVDMWVNGVLKRASDQEAALGSGRVVKLNVFVNQVIGSPNTVEKIAALYGEDSPVSVRAIDNSLGWGKSKEIPLSEIRHYVDEYGGREALTKRLREALEEEYRSGRISEKIYRAVLEP